MTPNPGHLPAEAIGRRVRVRLANGRIGRSDAGASSPPGWAADGRGGCRWTRTGSDFDIAEYEVIK
ncbi:hypothetical protein [Stakelama tenebrarum]|uniref:Uncharacterized protein n=1 Tax=Stakelama tenebrarum TaxID=2711215 RepID=A0A6G6Y5S8_9SPHN|nr:hypothetical protein [Sphingosinithalassobacter tenebrarum]QIG80078.1 hypothetical protein G5C33_10000 [Sphingosinithalassobacter tenebrarum]